jgi:hypothetical protein
MFLRRVGAVADTGESSSRPARARASGSVSASLDVELNNVKTTLDQILGNLQLLQNDSGTLKNGIVGAFQLSPAPQIGFTVPTVWGPGKGYSASPAATVFNGNKFYSCLVSHSSSSSFAADLAAGDWTLIADLSAIPLVTASQIGVSPAGNITSTDTQSALQQLDTLKLNPRRLMRWSPRRSPTAAPMVACCLRALSPRSGTRLAARRSET